MGRRQGPAGSIEQLPEIPHAMRARLERERIELLILFRQIDRTGMGPEYLHDSRLAELMELDADCAEALWALDQPAGSIDPRAMLADTLAALDGLPSRRSAFIASLPDKTVNRMAALRPMIEAALDTDAAYSGVPGRDPQSR